MKTEPKQHIYYPRRRKQNINKSRATKSISQHTSIWIVLQQSDAIRDLTFVEEGSTKARSALYLSWNTSVLNAHLQTVIDTRQTEDKPRI